MHFLVSQQRACGRLQIAASSLRAAENADGTKVLLAGTWGQVILSVSEQKAFLGEGMNVGSEVLSLRKDQGSSVEILLAAMDWQEAAQGVHKLTRGHAVTEAADKVLLKVAVHAAEAQWKFEEKTPAVPPRRRMRGGKRISRWLRDAGATRQLSFATFHN